MAITRYIEGKMKEFQWNLYDAIEWGLDREEELLEKIADLEKEIEEHICE